ncbi:MAG: hypothetical protein ACHQVS_00785 [Candidatus Babeliales bacterium]
MAKRHHSARHGDGHYEGHEGKRRQEMMDGSMIKEDHSAIANMPQGVIMREYPKVSHYTPENLDDTMKGIDHQMDSLDGAKEKSHMHPKKV